MRFYAALVAVGSRRSSAGPADQRGAGVVAPLDTSEPVGSESKLRRIHRSEAGRLELLQRVGLASVIGGRPPCLCAARGDQASNSRSISRRVSTSSPIISFIDWIRPATTRAIFSSTVSLA